MEKGTALSESACFRRLMSKKARSADNYYFLSAVLISLALHKLFHSLNLTIIQLLSRLLNLSIKISDLTKIPLSFLRCFLSSIHYLLSISEKFIFI